MRRAIAFCLAVAGAGAALIVATYHSGSPDVAATQSLPETPIAPAGGGEPAAAPTPGVLAERLHDAEVRVLLERLLTLDAVGALQDDALVRLVEQHLAAALKHAAAPADAAERGRLVARLADFSAGIDPLHALAVADVVADGRARTSFRRGVLRAWSLVDAEAVLAYIAAQTTPLGADDIEWTPLVQSDPEAALGLMQRGSPEMRHVQLALYYWARKDPLAATAYVDAIPDQRLRETHLGTVGRGYARAYPGAAWKWGNDLDPPSRYVRERLASTIASDDPDLFVTLVLEEGSDETDSDESLILGRVLNDVPLATRRYAERLADAAGPRANALLGGVISYWSNVDPDAALDWLAANADRIELESTTAGPAFFTGAFATHLERATEVFERLPTQLRVAWLSDVAAELASRSPDEAAGLVGRLEGEAGYDRALAAVILGAAARDSSSARNLFATAPSSVQEVVAGPLATARAFADSAAAAAWAETIADERVRQVAVRTIAATWSRQDEFEARSWVDALPRGPLRDAGLSGLLVNDARDGVLDEALLGAFTTAAGREAAVSAVVRTVARNRPELARELITRFVFDPEMRASAAAELERAGALGPAASRAPEARPLPTPEPNRGIESAFERAVERYAGVDIAASLPPQAFRARREAHAAAMAGGHAADLIEGLAAGLRGANRRRFLLEALERKAITDSYGAFRLALGLSDDALRTEVLQRIAPVWAEHDARGSLAAAEAAPIELRQALRQGALLAWARSDPAGLLRYIERSDISAWTPVDFAALRDAFAAEPEHAREVAQRFPAPFRNIIEGR